MLLSCQCHAGAGVYCELWQKRGWLKLWLERPCSLVLEKEGLFFFLDHHQITGHEKVEKTDPYFHKGKLLWLADSLCSLVFGGAFSNISSLLSNYTCRCTSVDAVITLPGLFWRAFRSKLVSDAPKVHSLVPLSQGGNAGHLLVHGRAVQFGLSRLRHFLVKVSSETVLALVQHQQLSVQSPTHVFYSYFISWSDCDWSFKDNCDSFVLLLFSLWHSSMWILCTHLGSEQHRSSLRWLFFLDFQKVEMFVKCSQPPF